MDGKQTWSCDICAQPFQSRGGRNEHRLKQHPDAPSTAAVNHCATGKLKCGECGPNEGEFQTHEQLCEHLTEVHQLTAAIIEETWKARVVKKTKSDFRCRTSRKNRKIFVCFRSGSYDPKPQAQRCAKNVPTIKAGFACSAFMRVKHHSDGRKSDKACIDHYGHEIIPKIQHPKPAVKSRVAELVADNRKPAE